MKKLYANTKTQGKKPTAATSCSLNYNYKLIKTIYRCRDFYLIVMIL